MRGGRSTCALIKLNRAKNAISVVRFRNLFEPSPFSCNQHQPHHACQQASTAAGCDNKTSGASGFHGWVVDYFAGLGTMSTPGSPEIVGTCPIDKNHCAYTNQRERPTTLAYNFNSNHNLLWFCFPLRTTMTSYFGLRERRRERITRLEGTTIVHRSRRRSRQPIPLRSSPSQCRAGTLARPSSMSIPANRGQECPRSVLVIRSRMPSSTGSPGGTGSTPSVPVDSARQAHRRPKGLTID